MVLDLATRRLKEALLKPFAAIFGWVHPNFVTLLAFAVGVYCAFLASQKDYTLALIAWYP
jgi:hypothetical protein